MFNSAATYPMERDNVLTFPVPFQTFRNAHSFLAQFVCAKCEDPSFLLFQRRREREREGEGEGEEEERREEKRRDEKRERERTIGQMDRERNYGDGADTANEYTHLKTNFMKTLV